MSDTTFSKVLRDAASLDDLRRNKFTVDFCLDYVEDEYGKKYHWGDNMAHSTFDDCLAYVVEQKENRG